MPPDRMKDTIVAQHITEADTARRLYDDGRARLAAKIAEVEAVRERLEAERDAAVRERDDLRRQGTAEEHTRLVVMARKAHEEVRRMRGERDDALRERDAVAAVLDDALEALRLLFHEVKESGNGYAIDFGWPKALTAARAALKETT